MAFEWRLKFMAVVCMMMSYDCVELLVSSYSAVFFPCVEAWACLEPFVRVRAPDVTVSEYGSLWVSCA